MFDPFRRMRIQHLARRVRGARRRGLGVYTQEWRRDGLADGVLADGGVEPMHVTAHDVLTWCRETMAATRRPFGLARFDLAIAAASASMARGNLSLPRLAPSDLYPGDVLLAEVERFLHDHGPVTHVAAALFSWGDAAHAIEGV